MRKPIIFLFTALLVVGVIGTAFGWQNTFCKIQIFGSSDFLLCDGLKDTLTLRAGNNVNISLDNTTDTMVISAIVPSSINVKSGSANILEGSCATIPFNTPFSSTPNVVATIHASSALDVVQVNTISTDGFVLCLEPISGGNATQTVHWVATDVGNP